MAAAAPRWPRSPWSVRERGRGETMAATMRDWREEVVPLSLRWYVYGDEEDDWPEKPRRYGVTEMRSPFYSLRPANQVLQKILDSLGPFVDGLKFFGGCRSFYVFSIHQERENYLFGWLQSSCMMWCSMPLPASSPHGFKHVIQSRYKRTLWEKRPILWASRIVRC